MSAASISRPRRRCIIGATVTIHSRFTPDTTLAAFERDRPTLTVLVPAIIQAVTEHPGLGRHRSVLAEGDLDRIDHRAAASDRAFCHARGAGAAGLWLDRNLPDRGLYTARRRSLARRLDRPARPVLRGHHHRRGRRRAAAGHAGRNRGARPQRVLPNTGATSKPRARRCATAGIAPAISACAMPTAISSCTTARRT